MVCKCKQPTVAAGLGQEGVLFQNLDKEAFDHNGWYTAESDICQIGVMLHSFSMRFLQPAYLLPEN